MTDIKYKPENCYTDLKQQSTEKHFLRIKKGTYFMKHSMNRFSIDKKQLLPPITNISPSGFVQVKPF